MKLELTMNNYLNNLFYFLVKVVDVAQIRKNTYILRKPIQFLNPMNAKELKKSCFFAFYAI